MLDCLSPSNQLDSDRSPPNISDLVDNGILLTGGGALIKGIKYIGRHYLHAKVAQSINAVIDGTKKLLKNEKQHYYGD